MLGCTTYYRIHAEGIGRSLAIDSSFIIVDN